MKRIIIEWTCDNCSKIERGYRGDPDFMKTIQQWYLKGKLSKGRSRLDDDNQLHHFCSVSCAKAFVVEVK